MSEIDNICFGCMEEIETAEIFCPFCGFKQSEYQVGVRALPPGVVLNGKYLLGRTLGEGGFGITYIAKDLYMKTKVAVKEYCPSNLAVRGNTSTEGHSVKLLSEGFAYNFTSGLERYVKEAEILSKLFNLPGIVCVKDFFYENGTAYIVMEYVSGISLKQYLDQHGGRLSEEETLRIMEPILSSLSVVHEKKLLHRDISPDNIMIGDDGKVKLIDFGAARYFTENQEHSMTVVLKHGYAPIEQYSRNGEQGEWTDIYALCATMYRMLTGEVPAESPDRVEEDRLRDIKSYPVKLHKNVKYAIMHGLSLYAKDRQNDVQELYDQLYKNRVKKRHNGSKFTRILHKVLIQISLFSALLLLILFGYWYIANQKDSGGDSPPPSLETVPKSETSTEESSTEETSTEETSTEESSAEETSTELTPPSTPSTEPADPKLQHAATVVRDGWLHNFSEDITVKEILDSYSDTEGTWGGSLGGSGIYYIYYQGTKGSDSFSVRFAVYSNDQFEVTGVSLNQEWVQDFNGYFKQILDASGI